MRSKLTRTVRDGGAALTAALLAWTAPALHAQTVVGTTAPEEVGLSADVLDRIGPAVEGLLEGGRTGGVLTLVARHGEVAHLEARGERTPGAALAVDDIFRIYSMTKPVTSVAAMILVEDGRLSLDDPVARHLPAFADVQVWDGGTLRPPSTPMTVRHLLSHTSGLTYGIFGNTPVDSMYVRELRGLSGRSGRDLAATVDVIASLPLVADPGARWNYSVSTDVLGRIVEVVSGRPLDVFFREELFEPLGMGETSFEVPASERHRLVSMYASGDGPARPVESEEDGTRSDWLSGGGGLYSTAADYFRFAQMLLNEGRLDDVRILEPATVREMRRNHLPDALIPIGPAWPDAGFGLGFAVGMTEQPSNFFWLGMANTYFWIDPDDDLVVFGWTQLLPTFATPLDRLMRPIVYEALRAGN